MPNIWSGLFNGLPFWSKRWVVTLLRWFNWFQASPFIKFVVRVIKTFDENRGPSRASSLAYTTLLALVPLLAVAVSVSTSLLKDQGAKPVEEFLEFMIEKIAPQLDLVPKDLDLNTGIHRSSEPIFGPEEQREVNIPLRFDEFHPATNQETNLTSVPSPGTFEVDNLPSKTKEVARRISDFINNIHSGTLGATSILALVLVAILLLRTVEATFNDIWGVSSGRGIIASIVQYWTAITLWPLVLISVFGLRALSGLHDYKVKFEAIPIIGGMTDGIPLVVLCLMFALIYKLMPNTKVDWVACLVGGAVSGFLLHLNGAFSFLYVSQVVSYANIYGGLAVIPLLLMGLYFSWFILLLGAQVSYAFQNWRVYAQEEETEKISQQAKEFISIRLMLQIAYQFTRGSKPPTTTEMATTAGIPTRLVAQILGRLTEANLIRPVLGTENGYTLARPINQIQLLHILRTMRSGQADKGLLTKNGPLHDVAYKEWSRLQEMEASFSREVTLEQLINGIKESETKPV